VGDGIGNFVPDEARVRYRIDIDTGMDHPDVLFEKSGPRREIFFDPGKTRAAIVTCGGLCPGINNVIRSIVLELFYNYGVRNILGIRYGYRGLNPAEGLPPKPLDPNVVSDIHREGGTILGTSRGPQDAETMVSFLADNKINLLFTIGGDGTQRGSHAIAEEVLKRGLKIAVIGIPKTIDNDILYVQRSFGYGTAIDMAQDALICAHTEAHSAWNGIGLVKIMGRQSGFIAAGAALASQEANFALVPEVPLELQGPNGFLNVLEKRMRDKGHALIVVAEGAGQNLVPGDDGRSDASGNARLKDIGLFLKAEIAAHFANAGFPVSIKYIDPSYIIRSVPANSDDSLLCDEYGRHAVHAAMAGKTDVLIGHWNSSMFHVPTALVSGGRRQIIPESELWERVIATTGQPRRWS
jgi:6-phosphofructokinase 1